MSIFISYRRRGGDDLAFLLHERLSNAGYDVFFDTKSLDDDPDFAYTIENSIINCSDFILVLAPGTLDSSWVQKEISIALAHNKHIIPAMKMGFEFPENMTDDLNKIAGYNAVNFPTGYFDAAYQYMTSRFKTVLEDISQESDDRIKRLAENGDTPMINMYALKNEMGTVHILENHAAAFEYYSKAANHNSPAACYNIADIYEKCADDPILCADYHISLPLVLSCSKSEYLISLAIEYYKKAVEYSIYEDEICAEKTYAPALYRLGVIYEKQRDMKMAFEKYRMSAGEDYPPALNAMGYYYQYGLADCGVDFEKAEFYYQKAKEKNLTVAIYNYARLQEMYPSNEKNTEEIISAYKLAFFSSQPIPQAAFALAKFYESSNDKINAKHYYRLALESGYHRAEKEIERLEQDINSSRISTKHSLEAAI